MTELLCIIGGFAGGFLTCFFTLAFGRAASGKYDPKSIAQQRDQIDCTYYDIRG